MEGQHFLIGIEVRLCRVIAHTGLPDDFFTLFIRSQWLSGWTFFSHGEVREEAALKCGQVLFEFQRPDLVLLVVGPDQDLLALEQKVGDERNRFFVSRISGLVRQLDQQRLWVDLL